MRRIAFAAALLLALGTLACASTPEAADDQVPTIIEVQNYNSLTVTVDAVSSGEDFRLGQVETTDTERFTLPPTVNEYDLRILVDPIGSPRTYLSDELVFSPGDVIEVEVESNLDLTSVSVR